MATLVLGVAGAAIGGSIGGAILGVSAATIGGFIGSTVGSVVDSWIVSSLAPSQRIEGARLDMLRVTSSTEGAVIPRLYGRMRMGGNIIWATDFREETKTTTQGGGKGGGGGKVKTTEYLYYASFAVALCEGPITGIGRIWADGKPMDLSGVTWRWYPGNEVQGPDPFIAARMGAANTPAYRGTAYVVFEDLPLSSYGNRLPQLSFEVFRPLADPDTAEGLTRAVTMIPASGEFTYATQAIRKTDGGAVQAENLNALPDVTDLGVALDRLQAMAPAVESVSLVVAWFGDDLRAGVCKVRPGVEVSAKSTTPRSWSVNGVSRANAFLVSRDAEDRPVYGGTPSDFAVVQAIQEMRARGLRVTFYPFILTDVPPGNTLPNPYSDNAAETGQPAFPWRGRIATRDRYDDGGFSGGTLERPGLKQLLADIDDGLIDVVVVYKIDRLSRSLMDFSKLVEVFDRNGVTFVSVTQSFNTTTSMGRLTLNILLSFAQFEREVIGERIRDKVAASRKRGIWMGGYVPLGYDVQDRKLVVNDAEAASVRRIFERFIALGSATALARELRGDGLRNKQGKLIDKGYLYRLINNRVYRGESLHKGKSYPGEHDAIIDEDLWDRAHAILRESPRKRANSSRAQAPALLKGLIFSDTGAAMTPTSTKKGTKLYRYYVSMDVIRNRETGAEAAPMRLAAGMVEDAVVTEVRRILQTPEVVTQVLTALTRDAGVASESDAIAALQEFGALWSQLFPAEQARIIQLLVRRVTVTAAGLEVDIRREGIVGIIREMVAPRNLEAAE